MKGNVAARDMAIDGKHLPAQLVGAGRQFARLRLQISPSPLRPHFVKARVKVRRYHNGGHAIFHGPRCLARYDAAGVLREDTKQAA